MLETFDRLIEEKVKHIQACGYDVTIDRSEKDSAPRFITLNLISNGYRTRISFWETGECEMELTDGEGTRTLVYEYMEIETTDQIPDVLNELLSKTNYMCTQCCCAHSATT